MQSIKVYKYIQVYVLDNNVLYVGFCYFVLIVYRCICIFLFIIICLVQIILGLGFRFIQFLVWFIIMDLLKIEFGVEMKKECFYFEEGYVFVNYVVYGEVFVLM